MKSAKIFNLKYLGDTYGIWITWKFLNPLIECTKRINFIPVIAFKLDENPSKTYFNVIYVSQI